jgi:hypothetical protein
MVPPLELNELKKMHSPAPPRRSELFGNAIPWAPPMSTTTV